MTAFQQKLVTRVKQFPGITDRELTEQLLGKRVHPSRVNQEARLLESRGKLRRQLRKDNRIGNHPVRDDQITRFLRLISW